MELHIQFDWDETRSQLKRNPESQVCTREENMRYASLTRAIRGENPVERRAAKYEMARLAFDSRDWYQPCQSIPGLPPPAFVARNDFDMLSVVRSGIRQLKGCTTRREIEQLCDRSQAARDASDFQSYVLRVKAVEEYNATCCRTLLMAHAWIDELNPQEDASALLILRELLRRWYAITKPAIAPDKREQQAAAQCRDFRWLRSAWRDLWETP